MTVQFISPETLSKPTGYSHVALVNSGRQVHLSGQVPLDAEGRLVGKDDFAAQVEQVYGNLVSGLKAAGADLSKVFKVTTYVVNLDPERAAAVRAARGRHFGVGPFPASTMVGIPALVHPDFLIEIEVIAALD
ncbi:MAG: RidA family protein [Alphaproteobacteria bacterium]|mgnify:CR=1 FL=1|nr:RidA family protein [Alphaproteobacteria bacterium]